MKVNVVNEKQNPHMKRKELILDIDHGTEATPSKASVEDALAKQISVEKNRIEIIDIVSEQGMAKSKSNILVWDQARPKPEPKKEEKPAEAAKPEEKKAEAPKEAPKEEKKTEAKPAEKKEAPKEEKKEEKK